MKQMMKSKKASLVLHLLLKEQPGICRVVLLKFLSNFLGNRMQRFLEIAF